MILTEARATVTQFARNAAGGAAVYSDSQIDRAIRFVGNHFVRETRCLKTVSEVTLASGDADVDLSAVTDFRPERLLAAYADGVAEPLDMGDWGDLWRKQVQCPASGRPSLLAFESWSTARVYPTPDQDYTLYLQWVQPFTVWTIGTNDPDSVLFNLPDDWLAEILVYGPPAVLQHNEEKARYASASWQKYLALVERIRGEGGLAERVAERARAW